VDDATVVIRPASVEGAEAIAAYHHRCWVVAFSSLLEPGVVDRMSPLGKLDRWRLWRLLQVGEDLLRNAGHRDVELRTIVGNERAIALYRSAGWTVTDRLVQHDQEGVVYEEHALVKHLG
jgi:hypothetical protein